LIYNSFINVVQIFNSNRTFGFALQLHMCSAGMSQTGVQWIADSL